MADVLLIFAAALLLTVAASLVRVLLGPTAADRMMGAQLAGTGGIAILLLLAVVSRKWAIVDVALILALLAAFAAVGFVKAASPDGAGDPEEQAPW
jgi:multicomponent Na+:H+ antiporter subunit F